jgi:predicted outer membrane repeat protein
MGSAVEVGMRYLMVLLCLSGFLPREASGETYWVFPDPHLGDFPNIQAAVDAVVDGDIIELADGVFWNVGNWGIDWGGKEIVIRSQSGNPEDCIIDGWAHAGQNLSGFYIRDVGDGAVLDRVTIRNGEASAGGGIRIANASPTITGCIFLDNNAGDGGGLLCDQEGTPTIARCTFLGNSAAYGGGIKCGDSAFPTITGCTFSGNSAGLGGGLCI